MSKILIVEGKNDSARIKQIVPSIPVLTTNGSEVSDEFLNLVRLLAKNKEIILFLDPDYSGEYIRKKLLTVAPNANHIFANKKDAISKNKKKVGVEHMSTKKLMLALNNIMESDYHLNVTYEDLYKLGLIGEASSKIRRQALCEKLNIGYVNGKQLVNRLNLFNITLEEIKELL